MAINPSLTDIQLHASESFCSAQVQSDSQEDYDRRGAVGRKQVDAAGKLCRGASADQQTGSLDDRPT